MSLAIGAQGTLLKIESASSAGSFTTVPECHKLTAPNSKFDLLETSSHDSTLGFKEYIPGMADGENLTASLWFVPNNTIHQQIRTDAYAKTLRNFKIVFPGTGTGFEMDFACYGVGFPPVADHNTVLAVDITEKVTGAITWT